MKNNSRNWGRDFFEILVDFDESDDIYIFIIEINLKKLEKNFGIQKLINLTIGITSVFSTLIPVIFEDIKIPTFKKLVSVATKIPMYLLGIYLWRYTAVSEVLALSFLVILKRVRGLALSDYEYLANDFICLKPKSTWTSDLFKKRQSVQKLVNVPCINMLDTVFHRFLITYTW